MACMEMACLCRGLKAAGLARKLHKPSYCDNGETVLIRGLKEERKMTEGLGSYLQELRVVQGLTTAQLARKAGIRRATLSEWQAEKRRPRLPELEAVLSALGISELQKRQAREKLRTPAQVQRLRMQAEARDPSLEALAGHAPHGGDLIRAMRLRRGWTQSQLAQRAGVSQATLVRWERAEQWPRTEQLHRVCYLLAASEDELVALTLGRFSLADGGVRLTEAEIQARLDYIFRTRTLPSENALAELRLLSLMGHAWNLATGYASGRQILAQVNSTYADHLYLRRRFVECRAVAIRALDIHSQCRGGEDGVNRAAIRLAEASAKCGGRQGLDSAIEILERWRFHPADQKDGVVQSGWMLADLARFKAMRGQTDDAMALGQQALQESTSADSHIEQLFRGYDLAEVLLHADRPREAHELLRGGSHPHFRVVDARTHPHFRIVDARTHFLLGEYEEADALLQEVLGWMDDRKYITQPEVSFYRPVVQALLEQVDQSAMQPRAKRMSHG
jgi:transcriptional regulator with XRE-family HTH domain